MVVAHFCESGHLRRLRWGRVRERTLIAGALRSGQHRYLVCDRDKAWSATSLGPVAPGLPQRDPQSHEKLEKQIRELA